MKKKARSLKLRQSGQNRPLPFDKYDFYLRGVQAPDVESQLLRRFFREHVGREPQTLREDFCGTFKLCCEWAALDEKKRAIGVDLDPEPLNYGLENYWTRLSESERNRVLPLRRNVLDPRLPRADLICALNASYYIFKKRDQLVGYFKSVKSALRPKGAFIVDVFGGAEFHGTCYHSHRRRGFTYFWDQDFFDPIHQLMRLNLNFKPLHSQKTYRKVFVYDWRLWMLPEVREALHDAGFKKTIVLWEKGTSGKFFQREKGEECLTWVAYILAKN